MRCRANSRGPYSTWLHFCIVCWQTLDFRCFLVAFDLPAFPRVQWASTQLPPTIKPILAFCQRMREKGEYLLRKLAPSFSSPPFQNSYNLAWVVCCFILKFSFYSHFLSCAPDKSFAFGMTISAWEPVSRTASCSESHTDIVKLTSHTSCLVLVSMSG